MSNPYTPSWQTRLALLFLFSMAIRVVFVFTLKDGFYFGDESVYIDAAEYFVKHGQFPDDFDRAPMYPLFLAGLFWLGDGSLQSVRIVQAVLGAIIALQIALIGKRVGESSVGIVAGILWAIYPMSSFMCGIVYPAILVTLLMTSATLYLLSGRNNYRYKTRVGIAGLLFGAATLTKPMVFAAIIFLAFWIFAQKKQDRFVLVSVFLLAALMALLPWSVESALTHGRLIPIESRALDKVVPWAGPRVHQESLTTATSISATSSAQPKKNTTTLVKSKNNSSATIFGDNKDMLGMFTRMAKRYPGEFLSFFELYPTRVGYLRQSERDRARIKVSSRIVRTMPFGSDLVMALSIMSVAPLYIFAVVGMASMWRGREKRRELSYFVLIVMSFALSYALSWGKIRYRVPVDPYIIILSAWGLVASWNMLLKSRAAARGSQDAA
ncbi:MAG: glycosyltransferase family 39 protein [Halioglobus sp.]|nr:glycosyltransferase family 39 protein [Halioglobus sp.]